MSSVHLEAQIHANTQISCVPINNTAAQSPTASSRAFLSQQNTLFWKALEVKHGLRHWQYLFLYQIAGGVLTSV